MDDLNDGWQEFEKISSRAAEMSVRVYKGGQFSLTRAVYHALNSEFAVLLYNPDKNKIGIRPAEEGYPNAYKLRQPRKQSSWLLSASAFLKFYNLENIKGNKYSVVKESGMVVIDINQPIN